MGLFISVAHAAVEGGEKAAEKSGMPQLAIETYPSQIFWLVVSLVVLYFVLSRVALPRVAGAIESRHDAIEDDLDRAGEFRRKAEAAESEKRIGEIRASAMEAVEQVAEETAEAIIAAIMPSVAKAGAVRDAVSARIKG